MISYRYNAPEKPKPKTINLDMSHSAILNRLEAYRAKHRLSMRGMSLLINKDDPTLMQRILTGVRKPKQITIDRINVILEGDSDGEKTQISNCSFRL